MVYFSLMKQHFMYVEQPTGAVIYPHDVTEHKPNSPMFSLW